MREKEKQSSHSESSSWRSPLFYVGTTLAAVALALLFFWAGFPDLIYDAEDYYDLSRRVSKGGPLEGINKWRTWAYPAFIALCSGLQDLPPRTVRLVVFFAQLGIYLASCAVAGSILQRVFGSRSFGRGIYAVTALNPFLLIHTTEVLTDLLSAVLVFLSVLFSLRVDVKNSTRAGPERISFQAAGAFFCAGLAVMVRPANLTVLAAVVLLWALRHLLWREIKLAALPLLLIAALAPFVPQVLANQKKFGQWEPLIVNRLYQEQLSWGMWSLKYATVVIPYRAPQFHYRNPFCRQDATPREFFRRSPLGYLATIGLHTFGLFDHDLPFTYVTNLRPWYRWPLSIMNYVFLALACGGAALALRRFWRRRPFDAMGFAFLAFFLVSGAYLSIHLPILVENRFSLPLLLLATPFSLFAAFRIRELVRLRRSRALVAATVSTFCFVFFCVYVSAWLTKQSDAAKGPSRAAACLAPIPRA